MKVYHLEKCAHTGALDAYQEKMLLQMLQSCLANFLQAKKCTALSVVMFLNF